MFFFITSNGLSIILIDPTPQKEKVEESKTASKLRTKFGYKFGCSLREQPTIGRRRVPIMCIEHDSLKMIVYFVYNHISVHIKRAHVIFLLLVRLVVALRCNQICNQWLELPLKKINMTTYFENLIVGVLYVLNIYVKFRTNEILSTI